MIHRFGDFELDDRRLELTRGGSSIPLQPKVLSLLLHLLRNRGRIVPKQELFEALWPDVVVSDAALTSAIRDLRAALGDRSRPRWAVQTLARRGYRFAAEVTTREAGPPSQRGSGAIFVGREEVLARLDRALDMTLDGDGGIVLLAGDPGIGKTRCAEILADRARARGIEVHPAWCQEPDGVPPYWPWLQLLRGLLGDAQAEVAELPEAVVREIAVLVPEHLPRPTSAAEPGADPRAAQLRLFEAVAALVDRIGQRRPLLLVLDDLHEADRSSLRLLEYMARRIRRRPILVAASLRDREPLADPLLGEVLSGLLHTARVERIDIGGLRVADIEEWLRQRGEQGDVAGLAAALAEVTSCNPLFIEQMLLERPILSAAPDGGLPRTPSSLRALVITRVKRLSRPARIGLEAASALGREFDEGLVAAVSGLERSVADTALREAHGAYLLRGGENKEGFRFANPLIQEIVYTEQAADRRARWHGRAMAHLGAASASGSGNAAALARHALGSTPQGDAGPVAHHAARAGRRAMELRAFEEAASYFDRALAVLGTASDPLERGELLLERGEAWSAAGLYHDAGRESFLDAAHLARLHHRPRLLARAALGLGGLSHEIAVEDETLIALLEESLVELDEEDAVLRARIMARLALETQRRRSAIRGPEVAEQALELSRGAGDGSSLGQALLARLFQLWVPERIAERRTTAQQVLRSARERKDPELELWALNALTGSALEAGSRAEWDAWASRYVRRASETGIPPHSDMVPVVEILAALVDGRLGNAERCARRILDAPASSSTPLRTANVAIQLQWLRTLRGEPAPADEVERLLDTPVPSDYADALRCIGAFLRAQRGETEQARALLEQIALPGFEAIPRNMFWLLSLVMLSEVCRILDDAKRAAQLTEMLEPFADRHVGLSFHYFGSVRRSLGLLARARSEHRAAVSHLEAAVEAEESMRAPAFAVRSRIDLGHALLARREPGDVDRGLRVLRECWKRAARLGMQGHAEAVATLLRPTSLRRGATDVP